MLFNQVGLAVFFFSWENCRHCIDKHRCKTAKKKELSAGVFCCLFFKRVVLINYWSKLVSCSTCIQSNVLMMWVELRQLHNTQQLETRWDTDNVIFKANTLNLSQLGFRAKGTKYFLPHICPSRVGLNAALHRVMWMFK